MKSIKNNKGVLLIIDVNEDNDELEFNSREKEEYSEFLNRLELIIKKYHSKSWEIIYLPNDRCDFNLYGKVKTNKENYSDRFKEISERFPFLKRFTDTEMHIALEPKEIDKIIKNTNNSANFAGNYLTKCVAKVANNTKKRNPHFKLSVNIEHAFSPNFNDHPFSRGEKRKALKSSLLGSIIIES